MERKRLIWIGMFVGSAVGGYIPTFFGESVFSISAVLMTAVGGIAGIWLGFKFGD